MRGGGGGAPIRPQSKQDGGTLADTGMGWLLLNIRETCESGEDQEADCGGLNSAPRAPHRLLRFWFLSLPHGLLLPSQVMRHDNSSILELDGKEVSVFTPSKPREKWQRKRTHVKLRVRRPLGVQAPRLLSC